jgi:hypothetical protein
MSSLHLEDKVKNKSTAGVLEFSAVAHQRAEVASRKAFA